MIVIFMGIVGIVTLVMQLRDYLGKNKILKAELSTNKYESQVDNKARIWIYLALVSFSVFSIVWGIIYGDETSAALGVILAFIGCGELISFNVKNKFYYNDNRCITSGTVVRYRSIKKIHVKKTMGIKQYELHTFSAQVEPISKKAIDIIQKYTTIKY